MTAGETRQSGAVEGRGQDVQDGEERAYREARRRVDERGDEGDEVAWRAEIEPFRDRGDLIRVSVVRQQPAVGGRVAPEQVVAKRDHQKLARINDGGGALAFVAQILGQEPGREGQERDGQQKERVDQNERAIDPADVAEDIVVVHPHDADGNETEGVPEITWPEIL